MTTPRKTTPTPRKAPVKPKAEPKPQAKVEVPGNVQAHRTDTDRPFVTSDRFSVAQVEVRGRELVAITPTNHVGPANLLIPRYELDELIEVLITLRDAPGPGSPNDA